MSTHRRAGEPHSLGHHGNVPFMDPALYMLRLPDCTLHHTDDVCAMRRKWRESCRRPLDLASARSRRQYVDMWGMQMHKCLRGIMPVTQTAVSAADAWGRDSVPSAVRCALAPVRVSWSGVRRPRCGPERPRCGRGAGVVMLDHTGGTVCSGTPHCTRGSARTCLHAYVPETAEYSEVGACRTRVHFRAMSCVWVF